MDPRITKISIPASTTDLKCLTTARGDKEAAAITPADLIYLILSLINSGFIGAA